MIDCFTHIRERHRKVQLCIVTLYTKLILLDNIPFFFQVELIIYM